MNEPMPDIDATLARLLEQVQSARLASSGGDVAGAIEMLTGASTPGLLQAIRQCALLRWFDKRLYALVCEGLSPSPPFDEFVRDSRVVERLSPGRWTLAEGTRARWLADWQQADPPAWRRWNDRLAAVFVEYEARPDARLDAVYHLAASTAPAAGVLLFRRWYDEADAAFDQAQCHALLEVLRLQKDWRGPELSRLWTEYSQYYDARQLFADDYFKTGAFLLRDAPLQALGDVLRPGSQRPADAPWVFHMHATGGTGKTMFLRWLTARYLVPRRIPTARVDFDDFALTEVVDYPLRLFVRIVEQWARQGRGTGLTPLLEKLHREMSTPGWNPVLIEEIRRQLLGSRIEGPIVVILDTLEEATLTATAWLADCVRVLRDTHALLPGLTLILSGRYDISDTRFVPAHGGDAQSVFVRGEHVTYELARFTSGEADEYLLQRGVADSGIRQAILARCAADDSAEPVDPDTTDLAPRFNPFKLAVFAELTVGRSGMTPEVIARMPRADVAYLIDRVVRRIVSQPLRWVIRYGAIARHLTPDFVDQVLVPPLQQVLRGELADVVNEGLHDGYRDAWRVDAALAGALDGATLWSQLRPYARARGWLTTIGTGDQAELRFHPEVVVPTRELLRRQAVWPRLQQQALAYCEAKIAQCDGAAGAEAALLRYRQEAVFHRFQADGPEAGEYWLAQVRAAEATDAAAGYRVAAEITGPDYAEGRRMPGPALTPALLFAAHCECADLLVQQAVLDGPSGCGAWLTMRQHVEHARLIAVQSPAVGLVVPPLLDALERAGHVEGAPRAVLLDETLAQAASPRDLFFLHLQLGQHAARLQQTAAASRHYREALGLQPGIERPGVRPVDILLALADVYEFEGAHPATTRTYVEARRLASDAERPAVLARQAWYALDVGDLTGAHACLEQLTATSDPRTPAMRTVQLEAQIALAHDDPLQALAALDAQADRVVPIADRARLAELRADAAAALAAFGQAGRCWEIATTEYDGIGGDRALLGAARCAVSQIVATACEAGNLAGAQLLIEQHAGQRGMSDAELHTELQLARAYLACRRGDPATAAEVLHALRRRSDPGRLRARVVAFALGFGFGGADDAAELCLLLEEMQPLSLRDTVFAWARYSDTGTAMDAATLDRLLALLPASRQTRQAARGRGVRAAIRRADLCRSAGHPDRALRQLSAVDGWTSGGSPGGMMAEWHLNLARERLSVPTAFGDLLAVAGDRFAAWPLHDALRCKAGLEALAAGNRVRAVDIARGGFERIEREPPSAWTAESMTLRARVSEDAEEARVLRERAAAICSALGWPSGPAQRGEAPAAGKPHAGESPAPRGERSAPSADPGPSIVRLTEDAVPPALMSLAGNEGLLIDRMLSDPQGLLRELRDYARPAGDRMALLAAGVLSALPWELVDPVNRATVVWRDRDVRDPIRIGDALAAPYVLVVRPAEDDAEISFEASSGMRLEWIYERSGIPVRVLHDPDPEVFLGAMAGQVPAIVHIVAAIRETNFGGAALDFESGSRRASLVSQQGMLLKGRPIADVDRPGRGAGLSMTLAFLSRSLKGLSHPPFLVLDITSPPNLAETVRMLLLRNRFASDLFETGTVRGILGCGLAPPGARFEMTRDIVGTLTREGLPGVCQVLRPGDGASRGDLLARAPIEESLSRLGAALWTTDPDDRLYASTWARAPTRAL